MRQLVLLILSAILTLSMAACGPVEAPPPDRPDSDPPGTVITEPDAEPEPNPEPEETEEPENNSDDDLYPSLTDFEPGTVNTENLTEAQIQYIESLGVSVENEKLVIYSEPTSFTNYTSIEVIEWDDEAKAVTSHLSYNFFNDAEWYETYHYYDNFVSDDDDCMLVILDMTNEFGANYANLAESYNQLIYCMTEMDGRYETYGSSFLY